MGYWRALIIARALMALLGWALSSLLQAHVTFAVPPLMREEVRGTEW